MENYDLEKRPLTAVEIKAQVETIQQVMAAVMKKDVHYGVIPGTPKPTLYKPGSEKILATFHIAAYPKEVDDLSTNDEIRYRVRVHGVTNGQYGEILVGVGIGECSSNEEKYKWRKPVCDEEFNETPEDRRRTVWKKYDGKPYQQKQVRTNPSDVANTILKMAKKRAQIDMTLTATAASDVFDQDLEEMTDELRESVSGDKNKNGKPPIKAPQRASEKGKVPSPNDETKISENQGKRFYAIATGAKKSKEDIEAFLTAQIGSAHTRDIPKSKYDTLCELVKTWTPGEAAQEDDLGWPPEESMREPGEES